MLTLTALSCPWTRLAAPTWKHCGWPIVWRRLATSRPPKKQRFTEHEDAKIVEMRQAGHTMQEIADALGRKTYAGVQKRINYHLRHRHPDLPVVKPRGRRKALDITDEDMRRRYDNGERLADIAKDIGSSYSLVKSRLATLRPSVKSFWASREEDDLTRLLAKTPRPSSSAIAATFRRDVGGIYVKTRNLGIKYREAFWARRSPEEQERLVRLATRAPRLSRYEIAALLDKLPPTGYTKTKPFRGQRKSARWTPQEEHHLVRLRTGNPQLSGYDIAAILGRHPSSVYKKVKSLGVPIQTIQPRKPASDAPSPSPSPSPAPG